MSLLHVIGVDPGLVHTGVVGLTFATHSQSMVVTHTVVNGPDAPAVAHWIRSLHPVRPLVFVEAYRPRQNLNADQRMTQAEHEMKINIPGAVFLPNMGIKRVITRDLMDVLEVWKFTDPTHHQDLRSAARIALFGMVKDNVTNELLADVVKAHQDHQPWIISHA